MASQEQTDKLYYQLKSFADRRGYFLNPEVDFTGALVESLVVNDERYGYQACPCRLATGKRTDDLDIICPCDYRDADITEFGACYCGLYVNKAIFEAKQTVKPIPERRPSKEMRLKMQENATPNSRPEAVTSRLPMWHCTVCGYLCARDDAPEICPICGATHDRFERFE